jgi:hypothetical protein
LCPNAQRFSTLPVPPLACQRGTPVSLLSLLTLHGSPWTEQIDQPAQGFAHLVQLVRSAHSGLSLGMAAQLLYRADTGG